MTPVIHVVPLRAQRPLSALTAVKSAKAIKKSNGAKDPEQDSLSVWERDGESITEIHSAVDFQSIGQQEHEQLYIDFTMDVGFLRPDTSGVFPNCGKVTYFLVS